MPYARELPQTQSAAKHRDPDHHQLSPQPTTASARLALTPPAIVTVPPSGLVGLEDRPSLPVLLSFCQRIVCRFVSDAAHRCYQDVLAPKLDGLSVQSDIAALLQPPAAEGDGSKATGESSLAALQKGLDYALAAGLSVDGLRQTVSDLRAVMTAVNGLHAEQSLSRLSGTLLALENLCSPSGTLAWAIGSPALSQLGEQLGLVRYWVEWLCRVSSLPLTTPEALLSSLYRQNLLPDWLQHALIPLESLFSVAEDEAKGSARSKLEEYNRQLSETNGGAEKLWLMLEILQDAALQPELSPYLSRVSPDLAAALRTSQLLSAEWQAVPPAGLLEELLGMCRRLGTADFQQRFLHAAGESRIGTLFSPVVAKVGRLNQQDPSLMKVLSLGARLSDPQLSWPDAVALLLEETSLPETTARLLQEWVKGKVLSWFTLLPDAWKNLGIALVNTPFWQRFSVTEWSDVPQLIRDTLCTDTALQMALSDVILGEEGRWIWSLLQLLMKHDQQAPTAVQSSWRVTLAQLIASGRGLASPPEALLTLAECILSLSLLYDAWHANLPEELASAQLLSDEMEKHLLNGPLKLSGKLLPWMPLLRQLSRLSGYVIPQAEAGDSLVSWLGKVAATLREQEVNPDELLDPLLQPMLQPLRLLPEWMTGFLPDLAGAITFSDEESRLLGASQAGLCDLLQRAGWGLLRGMGDLAWRLVPSPRQGRGGLMPLIFLLTLPVDSAIAQPDSAVGQAADASYALTERQMALDELASLEDRIGYLQIALGLSLTALMAPPLMLLLKKGVEAYKGDRPTTGHGENDLEMQALAPETRRDAQASAGTTDQPQLIASEEVMPQQAPSLLTRFGQHLSSHRTLYALEAVALGATLTSSLAMIVSQQQLERQRWDWMPIANLNERERGRLATFFRLQERERLTTTLRDETENRRVKRQAHHSLSLVPLDSNLLPAAVPLADQNERPAAGRLRLEAILSDVNWSNYPTSLRDEIKNEVQHQFRDLSGMSKKEVLRKIRPILSLMLHENYKTNLKISSYIIELIDEITSLLPDKSDENDEIAFLWADEKQDVDLPALLIYRDALLNDLLFDQNYVWARAKLINPGQTAGANEPEFPIITDCYEQGVKRAQNLLKNSRHGSDLQTTPIKKMRHIYFDLVREEIQLIIKQTAKHDNKKTDERDRLQAAKSYLNEMIAMQQSVDDVYPGLKKMPATPFYGDYRDVYNASEKAEHRLRFTLGDDIDVQHLLISALIYHINKERHDNKGSSYPVVQDIIDQFLVSRQTLHPFGGEQIIPVGYYPLDSLTPQGESEAQIHYMERFNKYIVKYAFVEAEILTRNLLGDYLGLGEVSASSAAEQRSLTLDELIKPVKKVHKYYWGRDEKVNKVMLFQLHDENWLLLVIINGHVRIKKYSKEKLANHSILAVLLAPEKSFGYCRITGVRPDYEPYDTYNRFYPYESKSMDDDVPMDESKKAEWLKFWNDDLFDMHDNSYQLRIARKDMAGVENPHGNLFKLVFENVNYHCHDIAKQRKESLQRKSSAAHIIAILFVPYYGVIYKAVTDSLYILNAEDVIMLVMDTLTVLSAGYSAGMKITDALVKQITKVGLQSVTSGLSRRAVVNALARDLAKAALTKKMAEAVLKAGLHFIVDIIEPIPVRQLVKILYRNVRPFGLFSAGRYMIKLSEFLMREGRYGQTLPELGVEMSLEDRARLKPSATFEDTFELQDLGGMKDKDRYIKQDGNLYPVEWDSYARTMRLKKNDALSKIAYEMPVKKADGRWVTHIDPPARHGKVRFRDHVTLNMLDNQQDVEVRFMQPGEEASSSGVQSVAADLSGLTIGQQPMKELLPIVKQKKHPVSTIDTDNKNVFKEKHSGLVPMQLKGFEYPPEIDDAYNFGITMSHLKKSWEIVEQTNSRVAAKIFSSLNKKEDDISIYLSKFFDIHNNEVVLKIKNRIFDVSCYLSEFLEMTKSKNYKNIVVQATKRKKDPVTYQYFDNNTPGISQATAWVFPSDPERRVFVDADNFSVELKKFRPPQAREYMSFTLLHESSHLTSLTDDILYFNDDAILSLSAKKMMDNMNEAISNRSLNVNGVDEFIIKLRRDMGYPDDFNYDQFYNKINDDAVFRANVILDNADCFARMFSDIAKGRDFDGKLIGEATAGAGPSRVVRSTPDRSEDPLAYGFLMLIIKSVL